MGRCPRRRCRSSGGVGCLISTAASGPTTGCSTSSTDRSRPPEHPLADHRAAQLDERLVQLGSPFVAGAQAPEVVQPGEGALDDPALAAQPGAVLDAAPGDHGLDAALPEQPAVLVEVIAAVGQQ